MRPNPFWLLLVVLLPAVSISQSYRMAWPKAESDEQFFLKELSKKSVLLQTMAASADVKAPISDEEARQLVESKLRESNDDELRKLYAQINPQDVVRIGIVLYMMMSTVTRLESPATNAPQFGGGFGIYLMYMVSSFVLVPEFFFLTQSYGIKISGEKSTVRYMQLALSLTALYAMAMESMHLVFGIAPNLAYAFSGREKDNNGNKYDVEFGGQNGARRLLFSMGLTAGILLQNYIMVRVLYSFGLTKLYRFSNQRLNSFGIILNIPLPSNR